MSAVPSGAAPASASPTSTVSEGGLSSPPDAPGSLTRSPRPDQVLAYLSALGAWREQLRAVLGELDRRARTSSDPDTFTADVTLAMTLCESIDRRTDELVRAWDSGRVLAPQLARIAELIWGRLPDALGNPSAFSLSEATTLAAALGARLASRLGADALAGSGVAGRIDPLRDTLGRCSRLAATLGRHDGEAEAMHAELDVVLDGGDPVRMAAAVSELEGRADRLERDLIKETSLRSSVEHGTAEIAASISTLTAERDDVLDLARRCRDAVAPSPHLAVPDVSVLGPGPTLPDGSGEPGTWRAAAAELDAFTRRLDAVRAALDEARRRYQAPIDERSELRGLLGAYRDRATKAGVADDPVLGTLGSRADAVLGGAPCDLATARDLVGAYQRAVLERVGRS